MNVNEHIIREQLDTFLAEGNYEACRELLLSDEEVVDKVNELAIAKCMLVVCEQEKEEGMQTLFEKVKSLEELVRRYTKLLFYIRRLDFDIMDDGVDGFRQFLSENRVSPQELFIVLYCGAVHKERVLQIIKDKMSSGEIIL